LKHCTRHCPNFIVAGYEEKKSTMKLIEYYYWQGFYFADKLLDFLPLFHNIILVLNFPLRCVWLGSGGNVFKKFCLFSPKLFVCLSNSFPQLCSFLSVQSYVLLILLLLRHSTTYYFFPYFVVLYIYIFGILIKMLYFIFFTVTFFYYRFHVNI